MARITYPTYYDEAVDTAYPFDDSASRDNGSVAIEDSVFVDGRFFPPNGRYDVFISLVEVKDVVTIKVSDARGELGSASYTRNAPPDFLTFHSTDNVYLGLLQAHPERGLNSVSGWPDGSYRFTATQTRFAASVVVPQPQVCVRAIVLDSGALFAGDVVLVGERGVQLTANPVEHLASSSVYAGVSDEFRYNSEVIRVDVVGDPLYVRRQCEAAGIAFSGGVPVQGLVFEGEAITPGVTGGIRFTVGSTDPSETPALRITPESNGIRIGFING